MSEIVSGKEVLPYLAQIYPQLYLVPGEPGAEEAYKEIVLGGEQAESDSLSHFIMNDADCLELVDTPAGSVRVVTLHERRDFEMFLWIMANKCVPYDVPATQGASTLLGLINWQKIREHQIEWILEQKAQGESDPDWGEEFDRFTADRKNFTDILIVLSTGPYSNVSASAVGMSETEWLEKSYIIRKYHECTHFFCRTKYPEQISPVWDEIVADAAGIIAALGRYDAEIEETFFGIQEGHYSGGRLENYVEDKEGLDELAGRVHEAIGRISELYESEKTAPPFDFVALLEEKQKDWWG